MKKDKIKVSNIIDKILIEVDYIDSQLRDLKNKYYEYMDILKYLRTVEKEYITKKDLEEFSGKTVNELLEE